MPACRRLRRGAGADANVQAPPPRRNSAVSAVHPCLGLAAATARTSSSSGPCRDPSAASSNNCLITARGNNPAKEWLSPGVGLHAPAEASVLSRQPAEGAVAGRRAEGCPASCLSPFSVYLFTTSTPSPAKLQELCCASRGVPPGQQKACARGGSVSAGELCSRPRSARGRRARDQS